MKMELLQKWEKKYTDLNEEYLRTKGMMTEREITECLLHLKSISTFIKDIQALHQPLVSDLLIAWEQFKKDNWYESEAVDVEKMLMDKFQDL